MGKLNSQLGQKVLKSWDSGNENISSEVRGIGLGDDLFIYLFSYDTKAKATKAEMNSWDIKLK